MLAISGLHERFLFLCIYFFLLVCCCDLFSKHALYLQYVYKTAALVAQRGKRLPAMRETPVQSLGQEDPLEKEMATHSSTLAWKIPRTEEPGRLQSMGSQKVGHD